MRRLRPLFAATFLQIAQALMDDISRLRLLTAVYSDLLLLFIEANLLLAWLGAMVELGQGVVRDFHSFVELRVREF